MFEQQFRDLVDEFEKLHASILKTESPRSYGEFFSFFDKLLNTDQIFFWKKDFAKPKGKQKFLSFKKTSVVDFKNIRQIQEKTNFKESLCAMNGADLMLKIPGAHTKEFFCFYFVNVKTEIPKNETIRHFFTHRVAGLISLVEKLAEVQQLNFIDDVTGLYNQRYLNILLDQEIERFKRTNMSFCVLFIDVDHFKNVNDDNGHMVGSQILKEIGVIVKGAIRAVDFSFRYGGDEFLTVLTNTTTEQAMNVAKRICDTVAATPFLIQGKSIHVTLSIGVACFPDHAQTKEKIIQVADHAMYCGKKSSRNIVYVAS